MDQHDTAANLYIGRAPNNLELVEEVAGRFHWPIVNIDDLPPGFQGILLLPLPPAPPYIAPPQLPSGSHVLALAFTPYESYLHQLIDSKIYHILRCDHSCLEKDILAASIFLSATPAVLQLENIAFEEMEVIRLKVRDRWEKVESMDHARRFLLLSAADPHHVADCILALDELINNALFHAFRESDGSEKYSPETFDALDNSECIDLEIGRNSIETWISVTDNSGSLTLDHVVNTVERHVRAEGLMDDRGRGLFLTRSLSDRMAVIIHQNHFTQVVANFQREANYLVKELHFSYYCDKAF